MRRSGWGRTGENFWGIQAHDITPDMLTFAKGIGNGLAIGGLVARAEIMNCLTAQSISTFGGNPLATVGALANLTYLLENDLQTKALKVGNLLMAGIRDIGDRSPFIAEVRGKGLMIGVELVKDKKSKRPAVNEQAAILCYASEKGLLLLPCGTSTIRFSPPLTLTKDQAEKGLDIFEDAIRML